MEEYIVTAESHITYEMLKDYHMTAQAIYDFRIAKSLPLDEPFLFKVNVEADNEETANEIVLNYLKKINEIGIINHIGHIIYITQAIIDFEGNFINDDAVLNDKALPDLELLMKLLTIKKNDEPIHLEIVHKRDSNKDYPNYSKIQTSEVIGKAIDTLITAQFEYIRSNSHLYSFGVNYKLSVIERPSIDNIQPIVNEASAVSSKSFKMQLLYTVCLTLLKYLNECTVLNPENKDLTNDQARVIYYTCEINGLLSVSHEVERDALNYIRMVLKNNSGVEPMLGTVTEIIL